MRLSLTYEEVKQNMKSVNKVILLGNLTRDPELRHTEHDKLVCSFGLATNRNWTTETRQKREEVEYHRIVAWDKLAEFCSKFLRKGRKVFIEGRLQYRTYTGQDGLEKFSAEIVLEDMAMLDSMPKDVRDTLEGKDASNGAPSHQV
jgi:single-strand DNA-binding protein